MEVTRDIAVQVAAILHETRPMSRAKKGEETMITQWIQANALAILFLVLLALNILQEIRFFLTDRRHRDQLFEMNNRLMSRNVSEFAMSQVAMGEAKGSKEEKTAAIDGFDDLYEEEMGFSAHGPYKDREGNRIAPVA